jgi:beta-aspartyl-peptidase (threonine type)
MGKTVIVVHGGAGPDSEYIKQNMEGYKKGIEEAINAGYAVLESGKPALDAVEAAVKALENNPLFNAGKGAALNDKAEVEMCASIMNGETLQSGAAAIVRNVKNPVTLARFIMDQTTHIYIGGTPGTELAKANKIELAPDSYFITEHQYELYEQAKQKAAQQPQKKSHKHGTVGAVALDRDGNLAAATSTGGLEFCTQGRIADSSVIGAGTYASNDACAVSCTGDGEYMIRYVAAYQIAALMEYKGLSVAEACRYLVKEKCKDIDGDMGVIAVDKQGNIGIEFNSERMHRGWKSEGEEIKVCIY